MPTQPRYAVRVSPPLPARAMPKPASLLADVIGERRGAGEKGACRIARLIEEDLIANGWAADGPCRSEQSIAESFGAGRSVVREAVRILEVRGVARMVPGPKGGLRVLGLEPYKTAHALAGYGLFFRVGGAELDEARGVLADVRRTIWSASGHAGDPAGQGDAILTFFDEALHAIRQAVEEPEAKARRSSILLAPEALRRSRAGQIAGKMLGECTVEQWVQGVRLGSEEDLCLRYGADRDAFRQAVRILESAGAAQTLCGRGHGLVSQTPRAGTVARLISCLFASLGMKPSAAMAVFQNLSVEIIGRSARKATSADCEAVGRSLDALEGALDREDLEGILGCVFEAEEAILAVCANPLLRLFAQSLRGYPSAHIPRDASALGAMNHAFLHASRRVLQTFSTNDERAARAAQSDRIAAMAALSLAITARSESDKNDIDSRITRTYDV